MKELENPLEGALDELGAVWGEVPWRTPLRFAGVDEAEVLRRGAGCMEVSQRGTLVVSGADRARWLHGLCTQDIKGLQPMQGAYACHVDIKGRILADLGVLHTGEVLLLDLDPGVARPLRRTLKGFVVMEQVKVVDRSEVMGSVAVLGAAAPALLDRLLGGAPWGEVPLWHARAAELGEVECLVWRVARYGVPAYHLVALRSELPSLWEAVRGAGAAPVGWEAAEAARIEAGRPRFGVDLGPEVLFNEAELEDAVSFRKGCYLGQEIIERVDARGNVNRRLRALLQAPGAAPLSPGAVLRNAERRLGEITSAAWVPALGRSVALGFVHRADNAPGAVLLAERADGGTEEVTVAARGALTP